MGKKKDKLLKQQAGAAAAQVPWKSIDADPVGFLVAPETRESFFATHWEQAPALLKATPERAALFAGLCGLPALLSWLRQRQGRAGPLEFGVDVNAARYRGGARETPNGEVADADTLQALHSSQGCTLQLHQPQRFFDPAWRLLAALERQMGCLVGSNAYLTPAGSQGLAPHHDDVELWVVQTAGTKAWRVYGPSQGYQLPNQPSGDLDQASLGKPLMEVTLAVGDVLYLPRGTVHQAVASGGADSAHLTISTYQRCSYADLATHLLQVGLASQAEPECLPLAARRSPAPGTLLRHSLHKVLAAPGDAGTTPDALQGLAQALRAIADKLTATPDMMTAAVHSSALDFLMNRLPPHPKQLPQRGPAPTLSDKVWCRVAGWCYLLPFEMTGMNCDDDEDEGLEEGSVKLVSCLTNSREEHMISMPDDEGSSDEDDSGSGSDDDGDDDEAESEGGEGGGSEPGGQEEAAGGADGADGGSEDGEQAGSSDADDADRRQQAGKASKGGCKKAAAAADDAAVEAGDGHACCGEDGCHHGQHVQEHSLSSGAAERENIVAALPGLVLEPAMVKAVVAFMAAEAPEQAVVIKDLPLAADAAKLQLAYALWAEGLAAVVPSSSGGSQQQQQQPKKKQKQQKQAGGGGSGQQQGSSGKKQHKRGAPADGAADGADAEGTATSSGKARPTKKAKA